MQAEHWVTLSVALIALIGTLAGVFHGREKEEPTPERKAREDLTYETTYTPESPTTQGNAQALAFARQALDQATLVSEQLQRAEKRIDHLETETTVWRRAHGFLYGWAELVERENPGLPPIPDKGRPPRRT